MKPITPKTLQQIVAEFPVFRWDSPDLEELVAPKLGIITGYQTFLNEMEILGTFDLDDLGLPGPCRQKVRR